MDAVDRHRYRGQRENPSFSSTLLDVIYRSIDERDDEESVVYRQTMRNRQSIDGCFQVDKQNNSVRPTAGSKNVSQVVVPRNSAESCSQRSEGDSYFNSNIGSSCSSYRVGFLSSEAETIYGLPARPRPIRTTSNICNTREKQTTTYGQKHPPDDSQTKAKREGKFVKTKSRAMMIYGYLKKGKQPNSPGGRLATFLISLFTTGNAKKSMISSSCTGRHDEAIIHTNRKSKSANASTSSSGPSILRSCLNKTPPTSRGKLTTGMKRSVRFYPGSVIVDEYCQPRGNKSLHGNRSDSPAVKLARDKINEELKKHLTEKNHHNEETTRTLLKHYQKKVEYVFDSIKNNGINNDEDYDDDEAASYASSDLFELDHLSAIGIDRCMEELPLYETTSVDANRAIANGFLV